jgi:serine phosphatase RsbU (regulator of sigma subunit)
MHNPQSMNKRLYIYIYTFLGVGLSIFIIGFIGINISLKYIQEKYIRLQLDVNKRQAEQMSYFIENQISKGISLDTIRNQFQKAISGTETDKGFLCMYDKKADQLICHPDKNAIGMKFDNAFVFRDINADSEVPIREFYKQDKAFGGIFKQAAMRTDIVYSVPIKGTDWNLNAHENIEAISKEIRLLRYRYIFGSLILGLLIAFSATFTARRISRRYEKQIEQKNVELDKNYSELKILHRQVNDQKNEIEIQRDFVQKQNEEISSQNKQITDSINYAKRIQTAVLPSTSGLDKLYPSNFVLFQPKDIVSGDFYWFSSIPPYHIIVAADCTGHGVPGAFMSMLGVTMLNEIVNKRQVFEADKVLDELREQIKISVSRSDNNVEQKDGMDLSLCIIHHETLNLQFAGAYHSLYILKQDDTNEAYQLHEIKGDKMPIGIHPRDREPFTNHRLQLKKSDRLYLFSDGFVSQFGGENAAKFKTLQFRQLLLDIQSNNMAGQKELLKNALEVWQGDQQQVDDILVIGIQI